MGCSRLVSVMLAFCGVIGCLLSTSANQETTGSSRKACDWRLPKAKPNARYPMELVRMSVAEANTVMRVRRSLEKDRGQGSQGLQWPPPQRYTTGDDNADLDQRPYPRSRRTFMRFGRTPKVGNDDIICRPVVADEEPEMMSADGEQVVASKRGDEKWFTRIGRDQGQYDYNGKPFMRFGKRLLRFGRSQDVTGSREGDVVCFWAKAEDEENGKKFIGFGKSLGLNPFANTKEDRAIDSAEDKRFLRFGKSSSYPVGMGPGVDYDKGYDQSKV